MQIFYSYSRLLEHLEAKGHTARVLGLSPDRSPIVAIKSGGKKLPAILISAGSHSTEQAGVSAAVELLNSLETEHQVFIIPSRDPMGMNGLRYVIGLSVSKCPDFDSPEELKDVLREHGDVVLENDKDFVARIGEYGYSLHGLHGRFQAGEDFLKPLRGKRVFFPSLTDDIEGTEPFTRAYTLIVTPEGEVLHINRFHDTEWGPVESQCVRNLMAEIHPGLTLDLHEYDGDRFWLSARSQRTREDDEWEEKIARATVGAALEAGASLPDNDYLPDTFFTKLENGAYRLNAGIRGEGLNLTDFAAEKYGLAFTIETGMKCSFEHRVKISTLAAKTAVKLFEERHRK
ncbi:MAG: hypothetical protein O3B01_12795 [Planctomycetota bacterium]|nr:hypothetical protein [Planctomycetota bacterium]MDA1139454.1 hypothetical protein [Planctomycetota bacterium]